jgi:excinuclease ABC subunit A
MEKPDLDLIEGLSPAISIEQKTTHRNPRSTVGTVTEIYDYLRLLYARLGKPHCPECDAEISSRSVDQIVEQVENFPEGTKIQIIAPIIREQKGEHKDVLEKIKKDGFNRVRINKEIKTLDEDIVLKKTFKSTIEIVVDRLVMKKGLRLASCRLNRNSSQTIRRNSHHRRREKRSHLLSKTCLPKWTCNHNARTQSAYILF